MKNLIFTRLFAVKCPAIIQNVRRRTGGSPDTMSGKSKINFAYSALVALNGSMPSFKTKCIEFTCNSPCGFLGGAGYVRVK